MANLGNAHDDWHTSGGSIRRALPAWISSMLLHIGIVLLLALTVNTVRKGLVEEPVRTTGIVLKHTTPAGNFYEGEKDNVQQASDSASAANTNQLATTLPSELDAPPTVTSVLPNPNDGSGSRAPAVSGGGGGNLNLTGEGTGNRNIVGGQARTGVFGVEGEGQSFVYVFDSSSSMSGRPLAAAKRQLIASLKSLTRTNEFQIIFYNNRSRVFNPTGMIGRLVFGTDDNKRLAEQFIDSVEAQLGTDHEPALAMAVKMQPDVIFFLTDGEIPHINDQQRRRIHRLNSANSVIHVIQFDSEGGPSGDNWLQKLARENRGKYIYFDVHQLTPRP